MGRLIDADKLKDAINNSLNTGRETFPAEIMYEAIDAQPTAYDPDKVVEQLEEFRPEMEQFGCGGMLTDIIDVVKAGGINDNSN